MESVEMSGKFEKNPEYKGLYGSTVRKYVVWSATLKNQLNQKNAGVVSLSLYKDKQTTIHQHIVEMLIK